MVQHTDTIEVEGIWFMVQQTDTIEDTMREGIWFNIPTQ